MLDLAILVVGLVAGAIVTALLFARVERLGAPERISLGAIGAGLVLLTPSLLWPAQFRGRLGLLALLAGLVGYVLAVHGPALWRRLDAALDDVLDDALGPTWPIAPDLGPNASEADAARALTVLRRSGETVRELAARSRDRRG